MAIKVHPRDSAPLGLCSPLGRRSPLPLPPVGTCKKFTTSLETDRGKCWGKHLASCGRKDLLSGWTCQRFPQAGNQLVFPD